MRIIFTIFCFSIFFKSNVNAQHNDSVLITALLRDIALSQVASNGEFYAGMFPSFRECGGAPHNYQPDNNIFFTAITAFTMRNMLPYLNQSNKVTAEKIIFNAAAAYHYYKDQYDYPYYNFCTTHS